MMCTYGEAFKPLVDASATTGWDFIDEGKKGAPKWGYISKKPGSVLKIVVNSMRNQDGSGSTSSEGEEDLPMNIMLAYLKSYNSMGMASFQ